MLGRLVGVTAAVDVQERVLGFVHTNLIVLPDYLGGARGGRLGHIYVSAEGRKMGLATRMWQVAENWLRTNGAKTVDVQAQVANTVSRALWPHLGFVEEVVQYRKSLSPPAE